MMQVRRRQLAGVLRSARKGAGLTLAQVVQRIDSRISLATLSRIESGMTSIEDDTLGAILAAYQLSDAEQRRARALAVEARDAGVDPHPAIPRAYHDYIALESTAVVLRDYEPTVIPGLFQIRDYARSVIQGADTISEETVEERVAARLHRQLLLTTDPVLEVSSLIDESVLYRMMLGSNGMRAQLRHLAEVSRLPNVDVRIVPYGAGAHVGIVGRFTILEFGVPGIDLVYVDSSAGQTFIDVTDDVRRYSVMHDHIKRLALDERQSRRLMGEAVKRMF